MRKFAQSTKSLPYGAEHFRQFGAGMSGRGIAQRFTHIGQHDMHAAALGQRVSPLQQGKQRLIALRSFLQGFPGVTQPVGNTFLATARRTALASGLDETQTMSDGAEQIRGPLRTIRHVITPGCMFSS